jgi:hypothetical protein
MPATMTVRRWGLDRKDLATCDGRVARLDPYPRVAKAFAVGNQPARLGACPVAEQQNRVGLGDVAAAGGVVCPGQLGGAERFGPVGAGIHPPVAIPCAWAARQADLCGSGLSARDKLLEHAGNRRMVVIR